MSALNPNLLEGARIGDFQNLKFFFDTDKELYNIPIPDTYTLLSLSIEGGIHDKVFKLLFQGENTFTEQTIPLLKKALSRKNTLLAYLLMNQLTEIESLDLSHCNLSQIPSIPSRLRTSLKEIDLSGNVLEEIDLLTDDFPALRNVNLSENPLSLYSDKCKQSWHKLRDYLQSVEERSISGIFKKLIIIGEASSEKNAFLKHLTKKYFKPIGNNEVPTDQLHSVQVSVQHSDLRTTKDNIILNIWDMPTTSEHSVVRNFLLTPRAIYMLCVDLSSPTALDEVLACLQLIQSHCKASTSDKNSNDEQVMNPVFVVGLGVDNKNCDEGFLSHFRSKLSHISNKILFRGYQGFYPVNSKSGRGTKELVGGICQLIHTTIGIRTGIAPQWILFNDCLQRMKIHSQPYLMWREYKELSRRCKIKSSVLFSCSSFLRDIGTLLFFDPSSFSDEKSLIILQPKWLCDVFLCFFRRDPSLLIENGTFHSDDITTILSCYPPYIHGFYIGLLLKYNVAHHLTKANRYLVPSLVHNICPHDTLRKCWNNTLCANELEQQRVYQFSYLPVEFFPRVIVRLLKVKGVTGTLFWENGALIHILSQKCTQKCKLDYDERNYRLSISVRIGDDDSVDDGSHGMLFRHVIEVVEILLESYYPRLVDSTERLVPCTHCLKHLGNTYYFTYTECLNAVISGKRFLYCHNIRSPSRRVPLLHLAPDICFADLHHIEEEDLEIGKQIGEGGFGYVYKGSLSGSPVAIKSTKDSFGEEERIIFWQFQQESGIMSSLQHPNIVKLFGVTAHPPRLIMELLLGDLCDLMHPKIPDDPTGVATQLISPETYPLSFRLRIALDIAKGMQYLQNISPPVIHRDLRSPNIFLLSLDEKAEVCAKVADFGLSRCITSGISGSLSTWQWLAPEVILEDGGEYGLPSDVYSFGIVLWELLTFRLPFEEFVSNDRYARSFMDGNGETIRLLNPSDVQYGIINDELRPTIPKECPDEISALLRDCWEANPMKRTSFDEIVYALSLSLHIPLKKVEFNDQTFARKHISLDLTCMLQAKIQSTHDLESEECELEFGKFHRMMETGNRFISSLITVRNDVWMGASDGAIIIRSMTDDLHYRAIESDMHERRVTSILAVNTTTVWSSSSDGKIKIWDVETEKCLETIYPSPKSTDTVKCLISVTLPDGRIQIWASSPRTKTIYIWDAITLKQNVIELPHAVHAMVQCDEYVWYGTDSGKIGIIHTESFHTPGVWEAASESISSFGKFKNTIWSGADDGSITMWYFDHNENQIIFLKSCNIQRGGISCIVPVGPHLWVASSDSLFIWDIENFEPIQESKQHHGAILSILRTNDQTIWTASTEGTIGVWTVNVVNTNIREYLGRASMSMPSTPIRKSCEDPHQKKLVSLSVEIPERLGSLVDPTSFEGSYTIPLLLEPVVQPSCMPVVSRNVRVKRLTKGMFGKFRSSSNASMY